MLLWRWFCGTVVIVLDITEVREGEREWRVDGPEEVVMDAHCKEDRAPNKKDGQPPI